MNQFIAVDADQIMSEVQESSTKSDLWVFDCDGTLINSDISVYTGWAIIRNGLCNPELIPEPWTHGKKYMNMPYLEFEAMQDHIIETRGVMASYEWEIMLQAGLSPRMVIDIASGILDECLKDGKIRYTRHVAKLAQAKAAQSWVVSGSSHPTVAAITGKLGIPPERVLATSLETVDGIYQPHFQEPGVVWEEKKKWVLEKNELKAPYFVAGDTIGDWWMMQMSSKWRWCVMWDDYRHRGLEWRSFLQTNVFKEIEIPKSPGFYKIHHQDRDWVIEIKGDFT
jgi:phosphoserine phosphatase